MTTRPLARLLSLVLISAAQILICHNLSDASLLDFHRLSLVIGGDWANYDMKDIAGTTLYDGVSHSLTTFDPRVYKNRVAGGGGVTARILYQVQPRFSAGINFLYLAPDDIGYLNPLGFEDNYFHNYTIDYCLDTKFYAPGIILNYRLPFDRISLDFSAGASWLLATASLEHWNLRSAPVPPNLPGKTVTNFPANGIGYLLAIGSSLRLSDNISILPNFGYRFMKTGDITDKNNYRWDGMYLDFSGPFVGMNFEIKP